MAWSLPCFFLFLWVKISKILSEPETGLLGCCGSFLEFLKQLRKSRAGPQQLEISHPQVLSIPDPTSPVYFRWQAGSLFFFFLTPLCPFRVLRRFLLNRARFEIKKYLPWRQDGQNEGDGWTQALSSMLSISACTAEKKKKRHEELTYPLFRAEERNPRNDKWESCCWNKEEDTSKSLCCGKAHQRRREQTEDGDDGGWKLEDVTDGVPSHPWTSFLKDLSAKQTKGDDKSVLVISTKIFSN